MSLLFACIYGSEVLFYRIGAICRHNVWSCLSGANMLKIITFIFITFLSDVCVCARVFFFILPIYRCYWCCCCRCSHRRFHICFFVTLIIIVCVCIKNENIFVNKMNKLNDECRLVSLQHCTGRKKWKRRRGLFKPMNEQFTVFPWCLWSQFQSSSFLAVSLSVVCFCHFLHFLHFGFVRKVLRNMSSCHPENVDFAALFLSVDALVRMLWRWPRRYSRHQLTGTNGVLAVWHFEGTIGIFHNKLTRLTKLSWN